MKRLKKISLKKNIKRLSSAHMYLSSFILKSGDVIGISARTVNWKPWYQVFLEYESGAASSFYDGPDQQRAFQYYMDLLTAFKGVYEAENFSKNIQHYQNQLKQLERNNKDIEYHNLLMRTPKFLGINDWG